LSTRAKDLVLAGAPDLSTPVEISPLDARACKTPKYSATLSTVSITEIERLHKERLLRLRQLQKELTLQNRAFVVWTRKPNDVTITSKWRTQRKLVEQAEARYNQAQEAYLSAVIRKGLTLP
jgi:hypothetical protein